MHFSKCKSRNVLQGCPQAQHGHLWNDDEETHDLIDFPPLSTKKVAREIVASFVKGIVFPFKREAEAEELIKALKEQIDATDLPEEYPSIEPVKKAPHLKLVE